MDEPLEKFFAHCSELAEAGWLPLSEEEVLAIRMFWYWLLEENPVYAAAPEMLEACQAAWEWLGRFGEHAPIAFGGEPELDAKLTAANAKARGE